MFVRTKVQARDYRRLSKNSCRHAFSSRQPAHFTLIQSVVGSEMYGRLMRLDTMPSRLRSAQALRRTYGSKSFFDSRMSGLETRCINLSSLLRRSIHYIRPRFCNGLNPIPPNGCAGKGRSNDTNVGALRRGVAYRGRTRPAASLGGLRDRSSAVPATGSSAISSSASSARSLATGSCARSISPSISEVRSRIELSSQSWGRCSSCSSLGCSVHAVCASASTNVWRR